MFGFCFMSNRWFCIFCQDIVVFAFCSSKMQCNNNFAINNILLGADSLFKLRLDTFCRPQACCACGGSSRAATACQDEVAARTCPLARLLGSEHRARSSSRELGQLLEGSFSTVLKPNFASKSAFDSSRRDLHNALLLHSYAISIFLSKVANCSC